MKTAGGAFRLSDLPTAQLSIEVDKEYIRQWCICRILHGVSLLITIGTYGDYRDYNETRDKNFHSFLRLSAEVVCVSSLICCWL